MTGRSLDGGSSFRGAYGLRLSGLPGQQWLNAVPDEWPRWEFAHHPGPWGSDGQWVGPDDARVHLKPTGAVHIDRRQGRTRVEVDPVPREAAYVHPLLGTTAILVAEWSGRLAFHGGCVLDRHGRAWALLGEREAGKSSTLAWFHLHGWTVFADDIVITDGVEVFVGPRCIDLREASAERFGLGRDLGVLGTRQRWRVDLEDTVPTAPFAGFVVLDWGREISLSPIPLAEKRAMLAPHRGLVVGQQHALPWLELLGAQGWGFQRPRSWSALDASMAILGDRLNQATLS